MLQQEMESEGVYHEKTADRLRSLKDLYAQELQKLQEDREKLRQHHLSQEGRLESLQEEHDQLTRNREENKAALAVVKKQLDSLAKARRPGRSVEKQKAELKKKQEVFLKKKEELEKEMKSRGNPLEKQVQQVKKQLELDREPFIEQLKIYDQQIDAFSIEREKLAEMENQEQTAAKQRMRTLKEELSQMKSAMAEAGKTMAMDVRSEKDAEYVIEYFDAHKRLPLDAYATEIQEAERAFARKVLLKEQLTARLERLKDAQPIVGDSIGGEIEIQRRDKAQHWLERELKDLQSDLQDGRFTTTAHFDAIRDYHAHHKEDVVSSLLETRQVS